MSNKPIYVEVVENDYYTSQFMVHSEDFPENPVYVYAECSRNKDDTLGFYKLALFFSVGNYAAREHLIGVYFGDRKMEKSEIDQQIRAWVNNELSDSFVEFVKDYLTKESLFEEYLDSNAIKE